jgi:hypothetical protein
VALERPEVVTEMKHARRTGEEDPFSPSTSSERGDEGRTFKAPFQPAHVTE